MLRHRAEQLSHPRRPAPGAGRRHPAGYRGRDQHQSLPPQPRRPPGGVGRTGPADPRQHRTGCENPPQVPPEEHHRPVPQCAGGLRRAAGYPQPPAGGLRRHPGLHRRSDLRHSARPPAQGQCADRLPRRGKLLQGRYPAQEPAGLCSGTAGPPQPALGREQTWHARMGAGPVGQCLRPADRIPRRQPAPAARATGADHGVHRPLPTGAKGRLQRRPGGLQPLVEDPQGHLPRRRRRAPDRHHGDHRRRHLPHRATGRGRQPPAGAVRQAPLRRGDHFRPCPGGQPALRLHPGLRQPGTGDPL
ncbi:hypothetical protein D3C85_897480 [compost metagenome]